MSGFVSILKKIGLGLLKGAQIVAGLAPIIQTSTGAVSAIGGTPAKVADKLDQIVGAVVQAETIIGAVSDPTAKTGSQKVKAANVYTQQIVQTIELIAGKHPKDPAAFELACQNLTGAVADVLNCFE